MRSTALAIVMLLLASGLSWAEKTSGEQFDEQKGLVVHEWGVFRVHDDVEVANADMKAEWDSLPKFIYGHLPGREDHTDSNEGKLIIVTKPVLFFHSANALELDVQVGFPGGIPVVWWPSTIAPISGQLGGLNPTVESTLKWHLFVKGIKGATAPALEAVPKDHWYAKLRTVQAEDVWVATKDDGRLGGFGRNLSVQQRERFVYYDGLPGPLPGVRLTFSDGKVTVSNPSKYPIYDLTITDRRLGDHVRIAHIAKLDALAKKKLLEFAEIKAKGWLADESKTLLEQLKKTGLNEDEALSLVDIWKGEFFQGDGVSAFFRLPQDQYERLLPLTLSVKPEKLVRVGLVHQPHCEPDLADRIARLVKDLNDDRFDLREKAQVGLEKLGPTVLCKLKTHFEESESPEVRRRLE
jgi:hypothetical protein